MHRYSQQEDSVIKSLNLLEYHIKILGKDIRHAGGQIDLDEKRKRTHEGPWAIGRTGYVTSCIRILCFWYMDSRPATEKPAFVELSTSCTGLLSFSCTFCFPFYTSSIKKARIKLAIFCGCTHNA